MFKIINIFNRKQEDLNALGKLNRRRVFENAIEKSKGVCVLSVDKLCNVVRFLKDEDISEIYKKEWMQKQK